MLTRLHESVWGAYGSVDFPQSNGYVEETQNKIMTVKHIAFEMRKLYHLQTK